MVFVIVSLGLFAPTLELFNTAGLAYDLDEGIQIRAARNISKGLGYTIDVPDVDLAAPLRQVPVTRWAPGYSFVLAALISLGLSMASAVVMFKWLTLCAACISWYRVARDIGFAPIAAAALTTLVPMRLSGNPTDLFCGALAGFLLLTLARTARERVPLWQGAPIILLPILMVLFKLSAVYFVAVAFVWLWLQRERRFALTVFVPGTVFVLIVGWLHTQKQSFSWVNMVGRTARHPVELASMWDDSLDTQIAQFFEVQPILEYVGQVVAGFVDCPYESVRQMLVLVTALGLVLVGWHFCVNARGFDQKGRSYCLLAGWCCLAASVLLSSVSYLFQAAGFAREYRYYSPYAPLVTFTLVWVALTSLRHISTGARVVGWGLLVFSLAGVSAHALQETLSKLKVRPLALEDNTKTLIEKAVEIADGENAVFMGPSQQFAMVSDPSITHVGRRWAEVIGAARVSKPIWLFVFYNPRVGRGQEYAGVIERQVHLLGMQAYRYGNWTLFYVKLPAGTLKSVARDL